MTHFVFLTKLSFSFKPYLPRNAEILNFYFHIHFAQFLEFDQNGRLKRSTWLPWTFCLPVLQNQKNELLS
jgi:hypothetical protein